MPIAHFDCFAGAAGDMIVGSLVAAGADPQALADALARLDVGGYEVRCEDDAREGIAATRFIVDVADHHDHHHPHRHLPDILRIIEAAALPPRAAERAETIFRRLAQAEAQVHNASIGEVHFHEVGAVDSIVDVVGACVALELLDVETVTASPVPLGNGTIECAHGRLPAPAPATVALLRGAPTFPGPNEGEATTPTAAAVLTALAASFGPCPAMKLAAVGYGAGSRSGGAVPNLLRVFVGTADPAGQADSVVELTANVDDCTGEMVGRALERLREAGCLDAWASPVYMKKMRPGWQVCALCARAEAAAAEAILLAETTTFGVRRRVCERSKLLRSFETVETTYGPVRVKVGRRDGVVLTAAPEWDDCVAAAQSHGVAAREVLRAAQDAWGRGERT